MAEKKERYQNRIELLQGTLDLLILQTLQWGPQHGYGISVAIRNHSGEILQVDTGSLYPALHRLEKQKWIKAEWKNLRKQPARKVLPTDRHRKEATRKGTLQVVTALRCDRRSSAARGVDMTQQRNEVRKQLNRDSLNRWR